MTSKYFKPNSLTWWASVVPILAGLFIATEPLHGLSAAVSSVENAFGAPAPVLINAGLAGIGIRGAVK